MCGRYAFDDIKEIYEVRVFLEHVSRNIGAKEAQAVKRGEVFPTETAAVLAQTKDGFSAKAMAWGYPISAAKKHIINARCETLQEKPMFQRSILSKKCLIPCTGFYEWAKLDRGKQKYHITPEGVRFFYLAGLYNSFCVDGEKKERFVIITAPANKDMQKIHSRMPLIVPKRKENVWLRCGANFDESIKDIYSMTNNMSLNAI